MASSDAHHENDLGCCFTEFDAEIHDARDLVRAIRNRRTVPCEAAAEEALEVLFSR
jgi:hypothetical protein